MVEVVGHWTTLLGLIDIEVGFDPDTIMPA
jgi:hypothetical protein